MRVASAGRALEVRAPGVPAEGWARIAPYLPGVAPGTVVPVPPGRGPVVVVPGAFGEGDVRRWVNAHLHLLHLAHGALCVHAVAVRHPGGGAVLLLGGHGAGKSLTALALAAHGWRVLAGDVTVLHVPAGPGERAVVLGGTFAFVVRRSPVRRWFPDRGLPAGPERLDLAETLASSDGGAPAPVVAAVLVDVDSGPAAEGGLVDPHTAATVWWRASGHLLDRLLDGDDRVLRTLEDARLAARRLALVRTLASRVPLHTAFGPPQEMAARIEAINQSTASSTGSS
ncbi:hypothetical protein [Kitasatospora sp. NPDC088783]|uniref:hypothetical protein n=1 Tax=Kitasatospora sp. NPDC088783 TaxID=3364077 RepID=UPI00380F18D2